jgi:hypothetical protein
LPRNCLHFSNKVSISCQQTIHYFLSSFKIYTASNHVPQQVSMGLGGSVVSGSFSLNASTLAGVFKLCSVEFCVQSWWFSFFECKIVTFISDINKIFKNRHQLSKWLLVGTVKLNGINGKLISLPSKQRFFIKNYFLQVSMLRLSACNRHFKVLLWSQSFRCLTRPQRCMSFLWTLLVPG